MYNNEDNDYMNNNSDNNSRNYENVEPDNNQSTGTTGYTTYSHNTGYNQNSAGGAGMNNGQNQYSNGSNNYDYNGYGYNQGGMNNSQYGANTSYNSTGTNAGYNNTAYNNGANTGFHNASDNSNSTYRYSYVNNNIGSDQNNSYRNAQRAAKQAKKEARKKSFNNWFSKNSTAKKYISGVLAAVVFGVVAGSAMYGTYHIEKKYLGGNDTKNYTISTVTSNIDKVTSDDINANGDTNLSQYSSMNVESVAQAALPAMVALNGTTTVSSSSSMYGWGQQQYEASTSGTGIIVGKNDDELLIATNYHVVEGADTLSVAFTDGNAVEASVKGFDEERDLAVVSVSLDDVEDDTMDAISIANIGSSDDLKVGEQVVAIGNALGYGQSVTTGIVSAKNRRMDSDNNTVTDGSDDSSDGVNLIQTDAAINPGNSGGALLNMEGEVVGINSAKLASTEVEGMGYAIAISDVTDILQNLMNETSRDKLDDSEHGVLGIEGSSVSSEAVQMYGIPAGVFVKKVTEGGAADKAGLKANSVITEFNGKAVSSIDQLSEYLSYYEPDEEVELTVQVPHGTSYKEETVKVTLDENTDADDSDDNDKDSKKSKKDSKKSSKDADEDVDEDTDSEDSMDSDDTEESENPFIQYFENQGFFR